MFDKSLKPLNLLENSNSFKTFKELAAEFDAKLRGAYASSYLLFEQKEKMGRLAPRAAN